METNSLTEKLNTFTSLVLKDAEHKRDELIEKVEHEYTDRMGEKENELLNEAYKGIQSGIHEAHKDANARVLHAELEAKKRLILRREEIIDEVMEGARSKLSDFINSGEYEKWLLDKIEIALTELGKGSKIVYVSPNDMKYREKIEALDNMFRITVAVSEEKEFLGGAKVYNPDRRIAVDYSFGEMLGEQKRAFLQSSGLALK